MSAAEDAAGRCRMRSILGSLIVAAFVLAVVASIALTGAVDFGHRWS